MDTRKGWSGARTWLVPAGQHWNSAFLQMNEVGTMARAG